VSWGLNAQSSDMGTPETTFHLRQNATFSDGTPVTANDGARGRRDGGWHAARRVPSEWKARPLTLR